MLNKKIHSKPNF